MNQHHRLRRAPDSAFQRHPVARCTGDIRAAGPPGARADKAGRRSC